MGLLSAVGNWFVGGGAIGAASAAQEKKKNAKAVAAVQDAADKNRALFENIYNTTRGDLSEYRDLGHTGAQGLQNVFGGSGATPSRPSLAPVASPTRTPTTYTKTPGGSAGTSPLPVADGSGYGGEDFGIRQPPGAPTGPALASPGGAGPAPGTSYPGAPQTTPQTGGEPDWQAYLTQYPDVAANAQQRIAAGEQVTPEQVAQQHFEAYGKDQGYKVQNTPVTGGETVTPDLMNSQRPEELQAPTYTRPDALQAPDLASYFTNFKADPGYDWRVGEELKGVNAASAVRGKLRSGDAAKALQDRAANLADQAYNTWVQQQVQKAGLAQNAYQFGQQRQDANFGQDRSYGTTLWDTQQQRRDNVFDTDRGYQTRRYDQNVNDLFRLTDVGANAAAGTASAGNVFANNTAAENDNVASARANAALNRTNPFQQVLQLGARAAGAYAGGGF